MLWHYLMLQSLPYVQFNLMFQHFTVYCGGSAENPWLSSSYAMLVDRSLVEMKCSSHCYLITCRYCSNFTELVLWWSKMVTAL